MTDGRASSSEATPALATRVAVSALAAVFALAGPGHAQPSSSAASARPAIAAAASAAGSAQPAAPSALKPVPPLADAVARLAKTVAGWGGRLGAAVVDVESGDLVAAASERAPLNPASNAKLWTAAAALALLRPSHRFETAVYGHLRDGAAAGLVLRGHGDPSLATRDLWEMARDLRDAGLRRVDGDIVVDQRFLDDAWAPPGFDQQPSEWAYFRAPVSALSLDGNTVTMTVRPGAPDGPAHVSFDPPGFVDVEGTVKTVGDDHPQNVVLELAPAGHRLSAKVRGSIPQKSPPLSFVRRVDSPALLGGFAFKSILVGAGIPVSGGVRQGGEGAKTALATHRSRPLSALLYELGKQSDNFHAETIFKALGAEQKGRPGRSADGADLVARFVATAGALDEGTVVKNGSGLFDADRATAGGLARLLRAAYRDPAIGHEFVAQLAIGGVDGTLHGRFRRHRTSRVVRAKTGTLESVAALSGFVLGPPGRGALAFSLLANDVAGKVSGTRAALDRCVEAMVRHLWGGAEAAEAP